jgi:hypothetical protein
MEWIVRGAERTYLRPRGPDALGQHKFAYFGIAQVAALDLKRYRLFVKPKHRKMNMVQRAYRICSSRNPK